MFYQKWAFAIISISSALLFAQSSFAENAFTKKYAPYIGYQHGYTSLYHPHVKSDIKYTPRFFVGINPIQEDNYKMGFEIGYTLPASYGHNYTHYDYWNDKDIIRVKSSIDVKNTDLYLTYYHRLGQNSHWFVKPGVEYYHRTFYRYENDKPVHESGHHWDSVYISTKAGAGYQFNKNLALNALAGSRFYDFTRKDNRAIRLLFNLSAEYTF